MQKTLRPYVTTGIAIVGAGLIAATPVATPLAGSSTIRDVGLTSTLGDALAPWMDQYNTAAENFTVLANNYFVAPEVAAQQFIANTQAWIQTVLNDPSQIPVVVNEIQEQMRAVSNAYTMLNIPADDPTAVTTVLHTLSGGADLTTFNIGHSLMFTILPQLLPAFLPPGTDADAILPILNFIASPASGMIMGMLGPGLSPWIALMNSINDGDGLNEIMANMTGAFFNGATLDLDFILPMLDGVVPPGTISHLDFAFGGLFSTGAVANAAYTTYDAAGNVVSEVPAVGGSIFNSVGFAIDASGFLGAPLTLTVDSHGVGPLGALQGWEQAMAGLMGGQAWNWDGKSAGAPPGVEPPLAGFSIPTIPTDFFDGGSDTGGADAGGLDWSAIADAFGISI
ncbi:outer membrane porin GjpA [Mycolicibacter sp. MYC123]|uniref:Outer membrane porin GjpA n=1 Tax=[Mycobacterium] zoologicum TaxID=2872311 RepID=A0ABU5YKX5_9MYCO|nr:MULTISPECIES: outer membrane porin GjpA [unclassified Mycolicibacter]MEB3050501.1 outer membrane porin GjpA [Mycolicibacter sp. MYC123]MEB3065683.1 outer membrane porin GjpA [Mycolicibacter sp. MYC101]